MNIKLSQILNIGTVSFKSLVEFYKAISINGLDKRIGFRYEGDNKYGSLTILTHKAKDKDLEQALQIAVNTLQNKHNEPLTDQKVAYLKGV